MEVLISLFGGNMNYTCLQSSQVASDSNVSNQTNKVEEKAGNMKYSSHSLDEVAGMIRNTLSVYECKVFSFFCCLTPFEPCLNTSSK